jgi:very-short-patch-repair endonuclease
VRSAGLPEPVRQLDSGDAAGCIGRVDFAYPRLRLVIELDGRRHHSSKLDFESDRARDNRLVAAGWRVIRFTWHQVSAEPDGVLDVLRRTCVI